ncbi:MAG: ATP-binding protein [Anaerolineae bacterium]|nr:ATP-binding protein [Anaerolineae bacterium]
MLREDFFVAPQFSIEAPRVRRGVIFGELLKISPHVVIFGMPGAGKTEVVVNLLLVYARQAAATRLKLNEDRLPVLMSALDLADTLSASPELSLPELLQKQVAAPHNYVEEKLAEGHFLIMLDQLNETPDEQTRHIIHLFETYVSQYGKNRFVIVARPGLKNKFNPNGPFRFAEFDNLSDSRLKALTQKWNAVVPDALNTLTSIIQEEEVYPLAYTPLHLQMLLVVGLTTRNLPTYKTQLYANYINSVLTFGDHEKLPPLSLLSNADRLHILQQVAYTLHASHNIEIEKEKVEAVVRQTLKEINDTLVDSSDVLIEFLLRSGLITNMDERIRFVHLSFQEFLAAQSPNIERNGGRKALEQQGNQIWWHEVRNFYEDLTKHSHAIDQAFIQETRNLPNIDYNQAYTLSLLVDNFGEFESSDQVASDQDPRPSIFDISEIDPEQIDISLDGDKEPVKIMVVDDTPQNIQLARFILQREKYIVVEAFSAQQALELIEEEEPSLILSDIQMPGMDGYEFCRRLKANPDTENIPFIFVTAFSRSTKEAARGLQIGADDYITRPFAPEELLARIGANVRIHQAEEAARRQALALARRNRELALLNQIQQAVTSSLNLDKVLDATMEQVKNVLQADSTSLWFVDRINQALLLSAAYNEGDEMTHGLRLPLQEGMAGLVVSTGLPQLSGNIQAHPEYQHPTIDTDDMPVQSMVCVPLSVRQQVIGVLQAAHKEIDHFNQEDLRLLTAVGDSVTVAIENAWLFGQIQLFNQQLERKVEARTHDLAREKEKTETILISIADGLLVTDPDNKIIMANRAAEELLNFTLSEVIGSSIEQATFDTPLWQFVRDLNAQADRSYTAQTEVADPNNSEGILAVQAHAAKMWDASESKYTGNVIVLRDVTALQEVDRMKARFMTGITHELKTPLAIMTLHVGSLLKYKSLDEAKRFEMLETIQRQANLLERLVENILELSRLDGGLQLHKEAFDLVELSRQITQELEPLAMKKGIGLNFKTSDDKITVEADPNQIERVVRNLVDNAIKYTNEGKIAISLNTTYKEDQTQAVVQVEDTGIGLSNDQIKRLFERFYRADPSHNIPGTGLGLSIAKEIAKKHNGDINVESEPGKGSKFTIYLPM